MAEDLIDIGDVCPRAGPLAPAWQHSVTSADNAKPEWSLLDDSDEEKLPDTFGSNADPTRSGATAPHLRAFIPTSNTRFPTDANFARTEMAAERRPFAGLTRAGLHVAWQDAKSERGRRRQDYVRPDIFQSNLIVRHTPENADGALDEVQRALQHEQADDILVEIRGQDDRKFLRTTAPSGDYARLYVDKARALADDFILTKSIHETELFLEPSDAPQSTHHVLLVPQVEATAGGTPPVRPELRRDSDGEDTAAQRSRGLDEDNNYETCLCHHMLAILRRISRAHTGRNLFVSFGRFTLDNYPPTKRMVPIRLTEFHKLMENPRIRGSVITKINDIDEGVRALKKMMDVDSDFQPPGIEAADNKPLQFFEVHSGAHRIKAELVEEDIRSDGEHDTYTVYSMGNMEAFEASATHLKDVELDKEMNYNILSLGRKFDWTMATVRDLPKTDRRFPLFQQYLRNAVIRMKGQGTSPTEYPRVQINHAGNRKMASEIRKTAVESVYRFRYGCTSYFVELTFRREWDGLGGSSDANEPRTTYNISLFGDHWQNARETWGNQSGVRDSGWGADLEHLFVEDQDKGTRGVTGKERVEAFVRMIGKIRDALDGI